MSEGMIHKGNVGRIGERIVANELEYHGFLVRDLNMEGVASNVDLLAINGGKLWLIQVKASTYDSTYPNNGWWFQYGYCTEKHVQDRTLKMFNRIPGSFQANIAAMVCVRSSSEYQAILLPVELAEEAAEINLNYAYRTKKSDGSVKKPSKVWFSLYPPTARTVFVNEQKVREQELVRPFLIDRSRKVDPDVRSADKSTCSAVLSRLIEASGATKFTNSL